MKAIILAGGFSSRAGVFKMTYRYEGKSILERMIESFSESCQAIVIVTGYQRNLIEEEIKRLESKWKNLENSVRQEGTYKKCLLETVYNRSYEKGMFTSVRCGVLKAGKGNVFLTPGDHPLVKAKTINRLKETSDRIVADVWLPSFRRKSGHPILLSEKARQIVADSSENAILKDLLNPMERYYVDVDDPGILMDVDTPEDIEAYKKHLKE